MSEAWKKSARPRVDGEMVSTKVERWIVARLHHAIRSVKGVEEPDRAWAIPHISQWYSDRWPQFLSWKPYDEYGKRLRRGRWVYNQVAFTAAWSDAVTFANEQPEPFLSGVRPSLVDESPVVPLLKVVPDTLTIDGLTARRGQLFTIVRAPADGWSLEVWNIRRRTLASQPFSLVAWVELQEAAVNKSLVAYPKWQDAVAVFAVQQHGAKA